MTISGTTRKSVQTKRCGEFYDRVNVGEAARDSTTVLPEYAPPGPDDPLQAKSIKESTKSLYDSMSPIIAPTESRDSPRTTGEATSDRGVDCWNAGCKVCRTQRSERKIMVLRLMFDTAKRDGLIRAEPHPRGQATKVSRPKPTSSIPDKPVTCHRSRGVALPRSLLELIARTGIRRGEAIAPKWRDVDLQAQRAPEFAKRYLAFRGASP